MQRSTPSSGLRWAVSLIFQTPLWESLCRNITVLEVPVKNLEQFSTMPLWTNPHPVCSPLYWLPARWWQHVKCTTSQSCVWGVPEALERIPAASTVPTRFQLEGEHECWRWHIVSAEAYLRLRASIFVLYLPRYNARTWGMLTDTCLQRRRERKRKNMNQTEILKISLLLLKPFGHDSINLNNLITCTPHPKTQSWIWTH